MNPRNSSLPTEIVHEMIDNLRHNVASDKARRSLPQTAAEVARQRVLAVYPDAYTGVGDGDIWLMLPDDETPKYLGEGWIDAAASLPPDQIEDTATTSAEVWCVAGSSDWERCKKQCAYCAEQEAAAPPVAEVAAPAEELDLGEDAVTVIRLRHLVTYGCPDDEKWQMAKDLLTFHEWMENL